MSENKKSFFTCSEYITKREAAALKRQLILQGWQKEKNPYSLVYVLGNTRVSISKSINPLFKEQMYFVTLW